MVSLARSPWSQQGARLLGSLDHEAIRTRTRTWRRKRLHICGFPHWFLFSCWFTIFLAGESHYWPLLNIPSPAKTHRTHSEKTPPAQQFPRCFPRKSVRVENLCPVYHDPLHLEDVDAAPSAPPATTTGVESEAKEERRQPGDAMDVDWWLAVLNYIMIMEVYRFTHKHKIIRPFWSIFHIPIFLFIDLFVNPTFSGLGLPTQCLSTLKMVTF